MCLPDFVENKLISRDNSIIGYRSWRIPIKKQEDNIVLYSEYQDYKWHEIEGPHEIRESDSGIYAYNNYDNYIYYNYYNNYNCDNYYNNYNYNNYYYYNNYYRIKGIINQWGTIAIHKEGQRSEFASVKTLFNIRISDAEGSEKFLNWIKEFNCRIKELAKIYKCKVISFQDFKESQKV